MISGTATLEKTKMITVENISPFGFWIFDGKKEYFVNFEDYPEFLNAPINEFYNFSVDFEGNLHWENLDIDIEKDSLETPEKYPLKFYSR